MKTITQKTPKIKHVSKSLYSAPGKGRKVNAVNSTSRINMTQNGK